MRDPDLKTLRLFVAVCEHRHIKRAAIQEHIEPSAVSKRIAQLENALQVRLLNRGRHGVVPTQAGEAILEHARTLLFTIRRMQADAESFRAGVQGKVRVVASASALAQHLLQDVALFMHKPEHRAIKLDIEERVSMEVVRLVRDGGAAIGICWDRVDTGSLVFHEYKRDELALAVPPGHPLAGRTSIRYSETLAYEQVGLPPWSAVTQALERAAALCGKRVEWKMVVSNFDAAIRATASGLAIAVFPRQVAAPYAIQAGVGLVRLEDDWAKRRFGIYTREPSVLSPAARLLLDHLVESAADEKAQAMAVRNRKPSKPELRPAGRR